MTRLLFAAATAATVLLAAVVLSGRTCRGLDAWAFDPEEVA